MGLLKSTLVIDPNIDYLACGIKITLFNLTFFVFITKEYSLKSTKLKVGALHAVQQTGPYWERSTVFDTCGNQTHTEVSLKSRVMVKKYVVLNLLLVAVSTFNVIHK